ncbi:hypothetical protein SPI_03067 [Niveomyces insectorum RCEF 264]|uniref:Uncharacterized protein n=1 Tax=Niveomyces insectorum RCEF 264 TaxID=1081102 RepID=A0A162MN73_9HYPO|nr:hypothetical protein SPI_03067 [Niveomyces insectorum RCEF 264]
MADAPVDAPMQHTNRAEDGAKVPTLAGAVPPPPPRVTSVVPAMFVPLDADITQPFEPPRDRVQRAHAVLQSIDYHRTGVRRGMLHLAGLDRQRIVATAAAATTGAAAPAGPAALTNSGLAGLAASQERISPRETEALIANMRGPALPGVDYAAACRMQVAEQQPLQFVPPADERPGGRREAVRQTQEVVEQALAQLNGYERHIGLIRARWVETLEKEHKTMDALFGTAPTAATAGEDRPGGGGSSSSSSSTANTATIADTANTTSTPNTAAALPTSSATPPPPCTTTAAEDVPMVDAAETETRTLQDNPFARFAISSQQAKKPVR